MLLTPIVPRNGPNGLAEQTSPPGPLPGAGRGSQRWTGAAGGHNPLISRIVVALAALEGGAA